MLTVRYGWKGPSRCMSGELICAEVAIWVEETIRARGRPGWRCLRALTRATASSL